MNVIVSNFSLFTTIESKEMTIVILFMILIETVAAQNQDCKDGQILFEITRGIAVRTFHLDSIDSPEKCAESCYAHDYCQTAIYEPQNATNPLCYFSVWSHNCNIDHQDRALQILDARQRLIMFCIRCVQQEPVNLQSEPLDEQHRKADGFRIPQSFRRGPHGLRVSFKRRPFQPPSFKVEPVLEEDPFYHEFSEPNREKDLHTTNLEKIPKWPVFIRQRPATQRTPTEVTKSPRPIKPIKFEMNANSFKRLSSLEDFEEVSSKNLHTTTVTLTTHVTEGPVTSQNPNRVATQVVSRNKSFSVQRPVLFPSQIFQFTSKLLNTTTEPVKTTEKPFKLPPRRQFQFTSQPPTTTGNTLKTSQVPVKFPRPYQFTGKPFKSSKKPLQNLASDKKEGSQSSFRAHQISRKPSQFQKSSQPDGLKPFKFTSQPFPAIRQHLLGEENLSNPVIPLQPNFSHTSRFVGSFFSTTQEPFPHQVGIFTPSIETEEVKEREILFSLNPDLRVMTMNTWSMGEFIRNGIAKIAKHILVSQAHIVGLQETTEKGMKELMQILGADWILCGKGRNVSIISKLPVRKGFQSAQLVHNVGCNIQVVGNFTVNVWTVELDTVNYGPYAACNKAVKTAEILTYCEYGVSKSNLTGRLLNIISLFNHTQFSNHQQNAQSTPTLLIGSFNSPSHRDWLNAARESHCDWSFPWPVTRLIEHYGFEDTFRNLNPDVIKYPGSTWSTVVKYSEGYEPLIKEPQDRIDYVFSKGQKLVPRSSVTYQGTRPLALVPDSNVRNNDWPSDHSAVITDFSVKH